MDGEANVRGGDGRDELRGGTRVRFGQNGGVSE